MTEASGSDWVSLLQTDAVRSLVDAIPGPVCYTDHECRYRFVNVHYARTLPALGSSDTLETLIGKTAPEAFPSRVSGLFMSMQQRALAGEAFTIEVGKGDMRYLNSFVPHELDGAVVGVLMVGQNVSAIHNSRTAMIHSERMAVLGRVVAGLLHESNTPSGALRSSLDVIERLVERLASADDATRARTQQRLAEAVTTARAANERLIDVGTRIRAFARIDEAELQQVNLEEGLDATIALLDAAMPEGISVKRDYAAVPSILGNASELNQVFMALLSNAIAAIDEKGTITVRTRAGDGSVSVDVADTGRGIDPQRLATIFDPVLHSTSGRVSGGLGLFVSRTIAERHSGSLAVESTEGQGATFTLTLPTSAD